MLIVNIPSDEAPTVTMKKSPCLMGKLTMTLASFNSQYRNIRLLIVVTY